MVLELDNSGGFTLIDQVVFKNCDVLTQDGRLHGARWLYDEIYKTDEGYEFHALLIGKRQLIDLIVRVTDIVCKQTQPGG